MEESGDQKRFIDAAVAAGVKRFMPSEYGLDTQNPTVCRLVAILPVKVQAVQHLKTKENVMDWSAIVTGVWQHSFQEAVTCSSVNPRPSVLYVHSPYMPDQLAPFLPTQHPRATLSLKTSSLDPMMVEEHTTLA